jgi:Domain of unknown function (DUF6265)
MHWVVQVVVLSMALAGGVGASEAPALPAWLAGSWEMKAGERWGDEHWTSPRGGTMFGTARIGRGEQLIEWETTRIAPDEQGRLAFWASPKGVPATKFVASEQTATSVSFVNTGHDYPQRVRYWREGRVLRAEIALADGTRAIRFEYNRAD